MADRQQIITPEVPPNQQHIAIGTPTSQPPKPSKNKKLIFGLIVLILVAGAIGGYLLHHQSAGLIPVTGSASVCDASNNSTSTDDTQNIIDNFQTLICKNFNTIDSFSMSCPSNGCGKVASFPPSTIAFMADNTFAPPRKVAGTNFFLLPYTPENESWGLDINTLNSKSTNKVLSFIANEITANHYSHTTNLLQSVPEPDFESSKTYTTFYSSSSLCDVLTSSLGSSGSADGDDILLSCAPISSYISTASQLQPIFKAYISVRPQFSNPQKSGAWLRFQPFDTSAYPAAYIFDSKTSGYEIGIVDILQITTDNYEYAAYFYENNGVWQLVSDNKQAFYAINCNVTFPNSDAHVAFIGQECYDQNTAGSSAID